MTHIAGTTQIYRVASGDSYPLRVSVGKLAKLKEEINLLVDPIRTISNRGFMGDRPVAELSRVQMKRAEEALKMLLGGVSCACAGMGV